MFIAKRSAAKMAHEQKRWVRLAEKRDAAARGRRLVWDDNLAQFNMRNGPELMEKV
jgi:hypothetical protein